MYDLELIKIQNDAYVRLAAEVVSRGIRENDGPFLQSNWCAFLVSGVVDWLKGGGGDVVTYNEIIKHFGNN